MRMQLTLSLAERLLSNDQPWSLVRAQQHAAGHRRAADGGRTTKAWTCNANAKHVEIQDTPRREIFFQPTHL